MAHDSPLYDATAGKNPCGRGTQKQIDVKQAKGFAQYLGVGAGVTFDGKVPVDHFRWRMCLSDGGTLESLPMNTAEFTRTLGALIPLPVIDALADAASVTVRDARSGSLAELIRLALQSTDGAMTEDVRDAVQRMIESARPRRHVSEPAPTPKADSEIDITGDPVDPDAGSDAGSYTPAEVTKRLKLEPKSETLRQYANAAGCEVPDGPGRSGFKYEGANLLKLLRWLASDEAKRRAKEPRAAATEWLASIENPNL